MSTILASSAPTQIRVRPRLYAGPHTIVDWSAFETPLPRKHELRNEEFVEMAGASYEHNAIIGDFYVEVAIALRGLGCEALGSDQKVYIDNQNGYYPDIIVVCGQPQIDFAEAVRNPFLIVEVLSPSTAAEDRGDTFVGYRTRPSLQHYIRVEQSRPFIEHYEKNKSVRWTLVAEPNALTEELTIRINEKTISIPLANVYRRVDFLPTEVSTPIEQ